MNTQNVRDLLEAIKTVKAQAQRAIDNGDQLKATELVGDLFALEACLVTETDKLLKEFDKAAA